MFYLYRVPQMGKIWIRIPWSDRNFESSYGLGHRVAGESMPPRQVEHTLMEIDVEIWINID